MLTTHDMGDLETLCERLILIDQGTVPSTARTSSQAGFSVRWDLVAAVVLTQAVVHGAMTACAVVEWRRRATMDRWR